MSKKKYSWRSTSYLAGRRLDRVYNSDQDLAGEVGPAANSRHHNCTVIGRDDRTGAVKAGTSKLPVAIRNLSLL